jgi:exodeoxyribonuclease-5
MIVFGRQQQEAIDQIKIFLKDKTVPAFLLYGAAGTGKTSCLSEILNFIERIGMNYCLCAPTHKASLVLKKKTERDAITLHKLLSLSPLLDIFELDFNDLQFRIGKNKLEIPRNGVVICDEASMISDDLYDILASKCKDFNCKLLLTGDFKQLQPVKSSELSKTYKITPRYELTELYRQSTESGLIRTLDTLRDSPIDYFEESIGTAGSLLVTSNIADFLKEAKAAIKTAISKSDILATKIFAFTNARVNAYNNVCHKMLTSEEYRKLEFLTCCENLEFNDYRFYNSMDYVIVAEPKKVDINIPNFGKLPGWQLELYDRQENWASPISILSKEISNDYLESLAYKIEETRLTAIELKKISRVKSNKAWQEYFKLVGSFVSPVNMYFDNRLIRKKSFDYGYACTVHRSQGSDYNNIFVDMKDIGLCKDDAIRRQLQYVALSRTRNNALIFQ